MLKVASIDVSPVVENLSVAVFRSGIRDEVDAPSGFVYAKSGREVWTVMLWQKPNETAAS